MAMKYISGWKLFFSLILAMPSTYSWSKAEVSVIYASEYCRADLLENMHGCLSRLRARYGVDANLLLIYDFDVSEKELVAFIRKIDMRVALATQAIRSENESLSEAEGQINEGKDDPPDRELPEGPRDRPDREKPEPVERSYDGILEDLVKNDVRPALQNALSNYGAEKAANGLRSARRIFAGWETIDRFSAAWSGSLIENQQFESEYMQFSQRWGGYGFSNYDAGLHSTFFAEPMLDIVGAVAMAPVDAFVITTSGALVETMAPPAVAGGGAIFVIYFAEVRPSMVYALSETAKVLSILTTDTAITGTEAVVDTIQKTSEATERLMAVPEDQLVMWLMRSLAR